MRQPRAVAFALLTFLFALSAGSALAQQSGYYVLDGFGGVHAGGGAPAISPQTPYFGFDAARDIVYVAPGSSGNAGVLVLDAYGGVYAGGNIAGGPLAPATPYFGFDIARGIAARSGGVSGWERRASACISLNAGSSTGTSVTCSTGSRKVTGGGVVYFSNNSCSTPLNLATASRFVTHSGPSSDNSWLAGVFNDSGLTIYVQFFALCANAS